MNAPTIASPVKGRGTALAVEGLYILIHRASDTDSLLFSLFSFHCTHAVEGLYVMLSAVETSPKPPLLRRGGFAEGKDGGVVMEILVSQDSSTPLCSAQNDA